MAYRALTEADTKPTSVASSAAWHPWAEAALLFFGLPVLGPSLFWMRVRGARWGRGPLALAVIAALSLALVSFQVPRLGILAAVALASAAALYSWKASRGTLDAAPCLGYSKPVVFTMVAGGALTALGIAAALPLGAVLHTSAIHRAATTVSTKQLADNAVPLPTRVLVRDGKVDPGRAHYRLPGSPAWFERMPPEQRSDGLEAWVPLEGTNDAVWVVFMGTNTVPMTATIDGHLASISASDALAFSKAQALAAPPAPAHAKKHGAPSQVAALPSIERVVFVGATQEVAERTARTDETRVSFDVKWAWLLAIGLVLVAFGMSRSVEDARASA
ncbi:MAG: hypothetical protein JST00_17910 [Deltaproteobacteria bacterium]|nr:hypothetical protein [Deltaproteobacteria bacterium]